MASNSFGRIGRLGAAVLKKLQYQKSNIFTEEDAGALEFHLQIIQRVPPRTIHFNRAPSKPLVLYTDAMAEPGERPGLGLLLFRDPPLAALGVAMRLPWSLYTSWSDRQQQIFPAEVAAVPLALALFRQECAGRDVIAFVDNEAAVSSLIRGSTKVGDTNALVELSHALSLLLHTRVWIEWIDSESNPSDGLSRLGVEDPWTRSQNVHLQSRNADNFQHAIPCIFLGRTVLTLGGSRSIKKR